MNGLSLCGLLGLADVYAGLGAKEMHISLRPRDMDSVVHDLTQSRRFVPGAGPLPAGAYTLAAAAIPVTIDMAAL